MGFQEKEDRRIAGPGSHHIQSLHFKVENKRSFDANARSIFIVFPDRLHGPQAWVRWYDFSSLDTRILPCLLETLGYDECCTVVTSAPSQSYPALAVEEVEN